MQNPIRLIGRWNRRLKIKRLVWRVRLLSMVEEVKSSSGIVKRKNLRMKVIRVTRNVLKSR